MAALLRHRFPAGVLDKPPSSPRSRTLSPCPSLIDVKDKPASSHKEDCRTSTTTTSTTTSTSTPGHLLQPPSRIPVGSWDSHMHVVDPNRYPLSAAAVYRPSPFTVSQAIDFETSIGVSQLVIVQPSIYGNDNSCLLDALRAFGPARARGVVAFDPATTPASTLREWHKLGVRGVRLNLRSTDHTMGHAEMEALLRSHADAVRPLGWVIQLYIPLHMVKILEHVMPTLCVRVCIDHMGSPDLPSPPHNTTSRLDPYSLNGFSSLIRLLQGRHTYVKLSAPYRLTKASDYIRDVDAVAKELIRVAGPTRAVFASDWPHTRFEGLDIRPWIDHVLSWCGGSQHLAERIFRDNAQELWT
ncbi:hypothetical protein DHEL01_v211234 [Diaporthe helianthi]|uniref:Amidohydrolase-related domain-containing protein n=1 Tax=Diaporthe helianthi TaxID=158607 RepID=A0A2P5HJE1_DIAHE|nr:hypothetical protein DHEL01_v211234 [Diaporthe helianthi]